MRAHRIRSTGRSCPRCVRRFPQLAIANRQSPITTGRRRIGHCGLATNQFGEAERELERDGHLVRAVDDEFEAEAAPRKPEVSLFELINAVSTILKRFNDRGDIREIAADPPPVIASTHGLPAA